MTFGVWQVKKLIESTRFIFDASGLLSVLEPRFGTSRRTLPGRKLSRDDFGRNHYFQTDHIV